MRKHTPGPWRWFQHAFDGWYLATPDRGQLIVMDFARLKMQSAQPRFATWEGEDRGRWGGRMIRAEELGDLAQHPDARLIASAPELLEAARAFLSHRADIFPCVKGADSCAALDRLEKAVAAAQGESDGNPKFSPHKPWSWLALCGEPGRTQGQFFGWGRGGTAMSTSNVGIPRAVLRREAQRLRRQARKDRVTSGRETRSHMAMLYLGLAEAADEAAKRLELIVEGVLR